MQKRMFVAAEYPDDAMDMWGRIKRFHRKEFSRNSVAEMAVARLIRPESNG